MSARHCRTLALALAVAGTASAQAAAQDPHASHGHHGRHADHAGHAYQTDQTDQTDQAAHADHGSHDGHVDHSGHADHASHADHINHGSQHDHAGHRAAAHQEGPLSPIPELTDADRAAAFPVLRNHHAHDAPEINSHLLFNRLEAWDGDHGSGQAWEAQGWIGGDTHRLWLRSEGERERGDTHAANLELLYGRSVSPWWDMVAGLRHDFAPGRSRDWVGVGVQGLAPYLFEVSATAWLDESGHAMLGVEVEYELLLTNRLILQPMLEATVHGKADPARGTGSGLSTAEAGLRLRYEFSPRFAPYVGVTHERSFGETSALRRATGGSARDTQAVVGFRFWF